jgi:hypothetical protein
VYVPCPVTVTPLGAGSLFASSSVADPPLGTVMVAVCGVVPWPDDVTFDGDGGGTLGAPYVNTSCGPVDDVPLGVVTVTSTAPLPAGVVAVIVVSLSTVKLAVVAPNRTWVAPVKFVPLIVTSVPPSAVPVVGLMLVTVGGGPATVTPADAAAVSPVPSVVSMTTEATCPTTVAA